MTTSSISCVVPPGVMNRTKTLVREHFRKEMDVDAPPEVLNARSANGSIIADGNRGETFVPQVAPAKMVDVAKALMGDKDLPIVYTGIRPGETIHEIMVSEEECFRTVERNGYYVILRSFQN